MSLPVPIDLPTRTLLWYRTRLAESILEQRATDPAAALDAALKALRGDYDNIVSGEARRGA